MLPSIDTEETQKMPPSKEQEKGRDMNEETIIKAVAEISATLPSRVSLVLHRSAEAMVQLRVADDQWLIEQLTEVLLDLLTLTKIGARIEWPASVVDAVVLHCELSAGNSCGRGPGSRAASTRELPSPRSRTISSQASRPDMGQTP